MKNTTITLFVPVENINDFSRLLKGQEEEFPIYGQRMVSPKCYQVNVDLITFKHISHLVKNF